MDHHMPKKLLLISLFFTRALAQYPAFENPSPSPESPNKYYSSISIPPDSSPVLSPSPSPESPYEYYSSISIPPDSSPVQSPSPSPESPYEYYSSISIPPDSSSPVQSPSQSPESPYEYYSSISIPPDSSPVQSPSLSPESPYEYYSSISIPPDSSPFQSPSPSPSPSEYENYIEDLDPNMSVSTDDTSTLDLTSTDSLDAVGKFSDQSLVKKTPPDFEPHSALFPSIVKPTLPNPSIENICKKTDYPALCMSSVSPLFTGGKNTDALAILGLTIDACAQYTQVAIDAAKKLIHAPFTPAQTSSILSDCADIFSDALDNLKSAKDAMASKDIGTINSMLSAAVTDFATCEDGFEGERSPMADYDNKLSNMASNCLAVASLIST